MQTKAQAVKHRAQELGIPCIDGPNDLNDLNEQYEVEYHLHIDVPNQPVFETVSRDVDEIVGFLLDWASQWGDQFSYGIVQNIVPRTEETQ